MIQVSDICSKKGVTLGRDTFTQKSEFQLGQYELVLQMYPVDQRKKI